MSKGTPFRSFRLPADLDAAIQETINRRNHWSFEEGWTFSRFIIVACQEKIAKMKRCRENKGRKRKAVASSASLPLPIATQDANP